MTYTHINSMKEEMVVKDLLATYYAVSMNEEIIIDGKPGFKHEEYLYFTILATDNKAIHMEQTTLAYYLIENGYHQTAFPIPNIHGDWITNYAGKDYIVLKVSMVQHEVREEHGILLARFHQLNRAYHYEPQYISSYGQWKSLWIEKCTAFEQKIADESEEYANNYYRLLVNVLPYIIGISENAIQYMQESEREGRHDPTDQGTISFQRYNDHLIRPIIWQTDLVFDHSTRDIAEFLREKFLYHKEESQDDVWDFLEAYQSVHPLTAFSWRLLYARLIFPVHLYDCIERTFYTRDFEKSYLELTKLLDHQVHYEQHLRDFFHKISSEYVDLHIPMLQWL